GFSWPAARERTSIMEGSSNVASRRSFLASAVAAPLASAAIVPVSQAEPIEQAYQFTPPPPAGPRDFVVVELDRNYPNDQLVYHVSADSKKAKRFGSWDKKPKRLAKIPFESLDSPNRFMILEAEWKSYEFREAIDDYVQEREKYVSDDPA